MFYLVKPHLMKGPCYSVKSVLNWHLSAAIVEEVSERRVMAQEGPQTVAALGKLIMNLGVVFSFRGPILSVPQGRPSFRSLTEVSETHIVILVIMLTGMTHSETDPLLSH